MSNVTRYNRGGVTPLSEAVDQLFRDAFTWPRGMGGASGAGLSSLGSNLYETDESYIMQVVLPGVRIDELDITARENVLSLRGRTEITGPEGARPVWRGAPAGEFQEQIMLPGEVDAEQATAEYDNGVLTLTLPKSRRSRVRTIKVGGQQQAIEGQAK